MKAPPGQMELITLCMSRISEIEHWAPAAGVHSYMCAQNGPVVSAPWGWPIRQEDHLSLNLSASVWVRCVGRSPARFPIEISWEPNSWQAWMPPARQPRKSDSALASTGSADAPCSWWSSIWDNLALPCCLDGLHSVCAGASQDVVSVPDGRHRSNRG